MVRYSRCEDRLEFISSPSCQGPVMAKVIPGIWRLANSHLPSGLNESAASDGHLRILQCNVKKHVSPHDPVQESKTREESDRTEGSDCNHEH